MNVELSGKTSISLEDEEEDVLSMDDEVKTSIWSREEVEIIEISDDEDDNDGTKRDVVRSQTLTSHNVDASDGVPVVVDLRHWPGSPISNSVENNQYPQGMDFEDVLDFATPPEFMVDDLFAANFRDFVDDDEMPELSPPIEEVNELNELNEPCKPLEPLEGFVPPFDEDMESAPVFPAQLLSSQVFEYEDNPTSKKDECIETILSIFPDMCRDHLTKLYDEGTVGQSEQSLLAHILDQVDQGMAYPKGQVKVKSLKRKRELDPDEDEVDRYGTLNRSMVSINYAIHTRVILAEEFSRTPMTFIDATMAQNKSLMFPTYRVLEEAERTWSQEDPPYNNLKHARKNGSPYKPAELEDTIKSTTTEPALQQVLLELQAARRVRSKADAERATERQLKADEEENLRLAEAEGTMKECGCCFGDYPINRMIHCNSDGTIHFFCRNCAKNSAETIIGYSKWQLSCMSMDGCDASFSIDQKALFLDDKTSIALDRNEQEAMLRMAGIENLASCPFCPYAAEYPPIEQDRLFRCEAEDCEKVSCRLCKLEAHIPKTCEEVARENGLSIRRQIEEAMSAAMIRRCNKCRTPFVKDEGCNKMTCTRAGCRNIQCYVCSQSCDYRHFNDTQRGGKPGNCPLFENVQDRHDQEVQKAEKDALEKIRETHPQYTAEDLAIKMSDKVKDDELKRKNNPREQLIAGGYGPRLYGHRPHEMWRNPADRPVHPDPQRPQGGPVHRLERWDGLAAAYLPAQLQWGQPGHLPQ